MRRLPRFLAPLLPALLALAPGMGAAPRVDRVPACLVYPAFWHTPLGIHRGTPQLLSLLLGDQAAFDDPQGATCARMSEFGDSGPQITAFGVDRGSGQIIYNPDMRSLDVFGERGHGVGQFQDPRGVACLADGSVAVADTGNNRVVFLHFKGGRLAWDHTLGGYGDGPGQFAGPEGVALDSQGRLYVADTGNNRVQVFDAQGRFTLAFGGDPNANNAVSGPWAVAVVDAQEPYSIRPQEALFVVDAKGARLQKFGLDGRFLGQAIASDLGVEAVGFDSLALDYFNNVWVTDRLLDQVHKFDFHLRWLANWGHPGQGDGSLDEPRGICIYRRLGQVVVLERESAQYLWIGADVADVRLSHKEDVARGSSLRIDYRLSERAWVDAWVEDPEKNHLATLLKHRYLKQGPQTLLWTGDLDSGFRIRPGNYFLVFQAEASYSSATYVKRETRKNFLVPDFSADQEAHKK